MRDEAVAGLPVAHIMGFVVLLSLAMAGIPVHFLPRFRPDEALDAIESAAGHDLHRGAGDVPAA